MASKAEEGEYERRLLEQRFRNSNPDADVQNVDFEGEYDSSLTPRENIKNIEQNTGVKLQSKAEIARETGVRNIKTQEEVFRDEQQEKQKEYMEKKYGTGYWKERKPRVVSTSDYDKEKKENVYRKLTPLEKAKVFVHTTLGSPYGRKRVAEQTVALANEAKQKVSTFTREAAKAKGRTGSAGFIFGKSNRPPLAPKYRGRYQRQTPYVQQQMRRPYRYYNAPQRVGPQSIRSDNLPQHFGPTHDYRIASSLRLFDQYAAGSPIAKYGGGLPRFWDSKPRQASQQAFGVNSNRKMFRKGVFG